MFLITPPVCSMLSDKPSINFLKLKANVANAPPDKRSVTLSKFILLKESINLSIMVPTPLSILPRTSTILLPVNLSYKPENASPTVFENTLTALPIPPVRSLNLFPILSTTSHISLKACFTYPATTSNTLNLVIVSFNFIKNFPIVDVIFNMTVIISGNTLPVVLPITPTNDKNARLNISRTANTPLNVVFKFSIFSLLSFSLPVNASILLVMSNNC